MLSVHRIRQQSKAGIKRTFLLTPALVSESLRCSPPVICLLFLQNHFLLSLQVLLRKALLHILLSDLAVLYGDLFDL